MADKINSTVYWALAIIISLIAIRLVSLGLFPLYDTTEARYGEMARIMVETRNWVTPQFDYDVPFWGKPPIQTWLSAISFNFLGINEFTARLPHLLCGLLTCCLVFRFTLSLTNLNKSVLSILVLVSSFGFIVAIGMVMTDSALLLAYTLAMFSYWQCYAQKNQLYGYLFFVSLALGMLIKGPVAVVLIGISLVAWSTWQGCFKVAIRCLPWVIGMFVFLGLTLPWYILAEIRTPGFLEYFIVGEHIQRFLVSGWEGDLYGTAHVKPRGTIWFYWLLCASPWSFLALGLLFKKDNIKKALRKEPEQPNINKYLICWVISPLLLFTLAGNVLPIYVLPGFSALAILIALNIKFTKLCNYLALFTVLTLIAMLSALLKGAWEHKSEHELLELHQKLFKEAPLYYWNKRPFSGQFYSNGRAKQINEKAYLRDLVNSSEKIYIAIKQDEFIIFKDLFDAHCTIKKKSTARYLLVCNDKFENKVSIENFTD